MREEGVDVSVLFRDCSRHIGMLSECFRGEVVISPECIVV